MQLRESKRQLKEGVVVASHSKFGPYLDSNSFFQSIQSFTI